MEKREVSWTVFMKPLSTNLWIVLIFVAIIIACFLTTLERCFGSKEHGFCLVHYLKNLWVASKANFGGKSSSLIKTSTHQIILFTCLLTGSIIWMAYRASLTSELSVIVKEFPFNNLESLLKTDYRYLCIFHLLHTSFSN